MTEKNYWMIENNEESSNLDIINNKETLENLIKTLTSENIISEENTENKIITDRESTTRNRLFKWWLGLGRYNPISLKTNIESAYRVTWESQIKDIIESGFVRPPVGKLKGGRIWEVHWSEGNDNLFYYDKRAVLEVDKNKVLDWTIWAVKITDLKAIWIFNEEKNCYENKINEFLKDFL